MRHRFGTWLANRRIPRIALIAGLLPLGLLAILSAAIVVCVAELKGWREAATDCVIALLILLVLSAGLGAGWSQVLVSAVSTWGMALGLGSLTGAYGSLTFSLQAVAILAVAGLLIFALTVADPIAFWEDFLVELVGQMGKFGVEVTEPDLLLSIAPAMSGIAAAGVLMTSVVALLLGSWWAYGGLGTKYRDMFLQVRLGYVIGTMAALSGIGAVFGLNPLAGNVLLVLGVAFVFQGLTVAHWQVANRGWPWAFLLVVYLPLVMGSSLALAALFVLAAVGFVDNWYDLRKTSAEVG
jgi:hypothetical protein